MNRRQKEKIKKAILRAMLENAVANLDVLLYPESKIKPRYKAHLKRVIYSECITVYHTNNLKIEIRQNEGKHGRPHCHVTTSDGKSVSIALDNFEILKGDLEKKYIKNVMTWIMNNVGLLNATWESFHGRIVHVS